MNPDSPDTTITRRKLLLAAAAAGALPLAGCASTPGVDSRPPIVFVHGNGDSAALWTTTLWRFETNGWPRERLFAIDLPYPTARNEDDKEQPGRTSITE
ncbi:MAG TPA: twin-arginine translocation pathway signal, partial [Caldimonas sp.]